MYMITTWQPASFVAPIAAFGMGSTAALNPAGTAVVVGDVHSDVRSNDAKQAAPPRGELC